MAMYHSWDSQNAWLRQIHTYNVFYVNGGTACAAGIGDGDWIWSSRRGRGALQGRAHAGRSSPAPCGPGTPSARRPARGTSP